MGFFPLRQLPTRHLKMWKIAPYGLHQWGNPHRIASYKSPLHDKKVKPYQTIKSCNLVNVLIVMCLTSSGKYYKNIKDKKLDINESYK